MTVKHLVETSTTATASAAVAAPLWITEFNPYIQLVAGVLGIVWLGVQIYYKLTEEK